MSNFVAKMVKKLKVYSLIVLALLSLFSPYGRYLFRYFTRERLFILSAVDERAKD
jgi:hypothetical protein